MKFSVLIPVYNTSAYLDECMNSVLNQTYKNFEVILVDDGSNDGSPDICDRYQDLYPDIVKVIHKENQGLLSARRVGIAAAVSDYCIFVDSDDYIDISLLSEINEYIDKNSVDVLIYSYRYVGNDIPVETFHRIAADGMIWSGIEKRELYEKLLFTNDVTTIWTKAVRTSLLKTEPTDYKKYYGKNMAEDLLQSLYILTYADKVGYTYKPLYFYRINDNSVSRSFRSETIYTKNTIHVYEKCKEYLRIWGIYDKEHCDRLKVRWFNDVMHMFSRYFESAKGFDQMKTVLSAEWNSLLPNDVIPYIKDITDSPIYIKLYFWLNEKKYFRIWLYFFKKKTIKSLRHLKTKVQNGK